MFYGTSLANKNPSWLNTGDHCSWTGVACNAEKKVTSLVLEDLGLTGDYPATLSKLSALTTLTTDGNALAGTISSGICQMSGISIIGDETNCPNDVGDDGCCSGVRLTSPSPYLSHFVAVHSGSSNCASITGPESKVCTFMENKANHAGIFIDYPNPFPYSQWLEVSHIINRCCSEHNLGVFFLNVLFYYRQ